MLCFVFWKRLGFGFEVIERVVMLGFELSGVFLWRWDFKYICS